MGDTGSPKRIPKCRDTTLDSQPDHLGGEGERPHTGQDAFGAKGHGREQKRETLTFLEQSRQPGQSSSNHRLEEGTRGNDWTSEPHQIWPGGEAGKEGREGKPKAGTDPHNGRKVHPGGTLSVGSIRKPLREKALQTNSRMTEEHEHRRRKVEE